MQQKKCQKCGKKYSRNRRFSNKQWESSKYCSHRCAATKRDPSQDHVVCGLYEDGLSCAEIGKKIGMSDTHVCRILRENGTEPQQYRVKRGGLHITKGGYLRFDDTDGNGVHKGRRLHCLIAEMVLGRPLTRSEVVHHKDGDTLNNHPNNLEVMTRGEHSLLHLREQGRIKLSSRDVLAIRKAYKRGETTLAGIASQYNVSKSLVGNIISGRARRNVC